MIFIDSIFPISYRKYIQMLPNAIWANHEFQKKNSASKPCEAEILVFNFCLFLIYNSLSKGHQY